jgi:hypothetical protein
VFLVDVVATGSRLPERQVSRLKGPSKASAGLRKAGVPEE